MNPVSPEDKKPSRARLKYFGLGFQMLAIIGLGTFGGYKLDQALDYETPIFTIVFSLISVLLALGLVVKDFLKPRRNK